MRIEQLLSVPSVLGSFRASLDFGGIDASPDGAWVAFVWNPDGVHDIYTVPSRGGAPTRLTTTTGTGRCLRPRWSPDGRHLAFLRDTDGDELFHVWLCDTTSGELVQLTRDRANREAIEWTPDGTGLVYRAHAAGRLGIWRVDAATGEERVVVDHVRDPGSDHITPDVSRDGRYVAFHAATEEDPANVVLLVAPLDASTAPWPIPTHEGATARAVLPRWGTADDTLAYTTDHRGRTEVAMVPIRDGHAIGEPRYLSEVSHDEALLSWGRTERILYRRSVDSSIQLRRHDPATGTDDEVVAERGVCYSAVDLPDGVAYVWTSPVAPQDLFLWQAGGATRRVTTSLPASIPTSSLTMPEHVWYPGADGQPTPALLYRPAGSGSDAAAAGPPPAIVWAHGGGTWQHLQAWDPIPQWLTQHGYVVLAPNARGSRGYGRAFREGNVRDWGGKDLEDHVRGADWLEAEGLADGARIGIYGSSGGGYMVSIALTCAPARWAAGCTSCGIVSLETFYRSTRADLRGMVESYMGSPDQDPDRFRERSPLTHLHRITAPVLILHGGTDPRVPVTEAQLMAARLEELGATHELHVYPDEGHGFRSLTNQADALRRMVAWFDQHLR